MCCVQGYLTIADLYTFFREIHALWVNMGEYAELEIYDVLDEIMDMVKPATPGRITKADLLACKMSGTVFSILANVDQFYTYNFRYVVWLVFLLVTIMPPGVWLT